MLQDAFTLVLKVVERKMLSNLFFDFYIYLLEKHFKLEKFYPARIKQNLTHKKLQQGENYVPEKNEIGKCKLNAKLFNKLA